jgi:hypothetical protein
MVAVVNGSGLGLFTTLGSSGSPALGQSRVPRTQTTNTVKAHFFFFANGQATGSVGQLAADNPFSSAPYANFDVNYTSALEQTGPTSVPEVVAREGETLRMIA